MVSGKVDLPREKSSPQCSQGKLSPTIVEVKTCTAVGCSSDSALSFTTTPDKPKQVSLRASGNSVQVMVLKPGEKDGGSKVTSLKVFYSRNEGDYMEYQKGGDVLVFENGTLPKHYRIHACSTMGCSKDFATASIRIPDQPTKVTASIASGSFLKVIIEPPIDDGGVGKSIQ